MSAQIIKQITALIHENRLDEAKSIIKRIADENPADPSLMCDLGKLEFLMGDFAQAKQYLHSALNLNPQNYEPHYQSGLVLLREGEPKQAMPMFRQACELRPDFALGHFYWGLTLYNMGNLTGALGQFKASVRADKSLYTATYYSGLTNQRLNQWEEARQDFSQTIATEPDFAAAHNALGTTLVQLGKMPEAISAFEKACKLRSDFALAHFNLATVLAISYQFDQAQVHYREALNSPEMSAAQRGLIYNNLAIMLVQNQQWEAAYEYLLQAKNIAPNLLEAHLNLGLVQMALQEYDLSLTSFEQILTDFPSNTEANYYAGIALLCLRQYKIAQEKLTAAAMSGPQAYFWLGWAYLADQNYAQAKAQFEKITAGVQPDGQQIDSRLFALSLDALGLCSALAGHHEESIPYFDRAIKTDAKLALAYLHRARSNEALHQVDLAQKDYTQALELDSSCLDTDKDQIAQLLKDSKTEEALAKAAKILSFQPQDLKSQLLLARALKDKKAYTEALSLLSSIMVQAPESGEAYTILGQIYSAQSDFAKADEIFNQASQLADVDAELFLHWAKALNSLGLSELALEKFRKAADINPYDTEIYENWGQTLKALQRFDEATEVFKLASSYL